MKKLGILAAILIFCFCSVPLEAAITAKNLHVHTYGGGALLEKVFNAVSMLMYGKNGGYKGIMMFCGLIGGFCAIILAFSKGSWEPLITHWFFPACMIFFIIMAPKDSVIIQDHLVPKAGSTTEQPVYKVDNVPFALKLVAGTISTLTYEVTRALENVTHGVNDSKYNWTGHIYAGDTLFQSGKVQVNDPVLEQNIHNLVYDCVFNDIKQRIPRYTKKDLYNTKDILGFIAPKTNAMISTRMMDDKGESIPMKCHHAAAKIQEDFKALTLGGSLAFFNQRNSSSEDALKSKIFGEISSEASLLSGLKNDAMKEHKNMMLQSLMIDSTQQSLTPKAYATLKAEQLHKQQQGILGAMGAKSIVAMKNFFEAIIYMSFPIILMLAVCIMGFRTIATWLQFLLWISLWPPFFVVVNFLLNTTWDLRVAKVFGMGDIGLTIFSSHGLADLYSSMESIAAGALFSVPFLAFAIVKGGVHSMVQLSSSLNAPAQSAASQAANERVSGNYSVGNLSFANENVSSTCMFQENKNPLFQQGAMTASQGLNTVKMASDGGVTMSRDQSVFGADVSINEAYGYGVQKQFTESEQLLKSKTDTFNESWSQVGSSGKNFMDSLGNDHSFGHLISKAEQDQASELFTKTEQQAEDIARTYGIDKSTAYEYAAKIGAGVSLKGLVDVGGSASTTGGTKHGDSEAVAARDSDFRSLNENLQKLRSFSTQDSDSENISAATRASNDFGNQVSIAESATEQLSVAQNNHKTWQHIHDNWEKSSSDVKQSLNNEFMSHMLNKHGDSLSVASVLNQPEELQKNLTEFSSQKVNKMLSSKFENIQDEIKTMHANNEVVSKQVSEMPTKVANVKSNVITRMNEGPDIGAEYKGLEDQYETKKAKPIKNKIQAEKGIKQKKTEMAETKVSKEHKEKVKKTAQEQASVTLAKDTGKGVSKFMKGQKKKAYARSERLQQELKRREEK